MHLLETPHKIRQCVPRILQRQGQPCRQAPFRLFFPVRPLQFCRRGPKLPVVNPLFTLRCYLLLRRLDPFRLRRNQPLLLLSLHPLLLLLFLLVGPLISRLVYHLFLCHPPCRCFLRYCRQRSRQVHHRLRLQFRLPLQLPARYRRRLIRALTFWEYCFLQ